ncbi:MAG TPA: hypothetical protein VMV74_12575 [Bacteroidales bacterium]|nr:hypothetical protein [Bacteroidales bacterium]
MKQLKKLLLLTMALCLLISCGRSDKTSGGKSKLKKGKVEMVTLPFDVNALGNYTYVGSDTLPNPKCSEPLTAWRAIVDGNGTGTPIGDFKMHFDFCGDSLSNYGNTYAYLVASDGDTLFISCEGRVLEGRLDDHPVFVTSYWKDPFAILGGTGKYEEATGTAMTDDYNSSEDPNSHHHWTGTITMMKAKR